MSDARLDWRQAAGKDRRIREVFGDGLPRLWWFKFHDRRAPTAEELETLRLAFMRQAAVMRVTADAYRSTALQGNPYAVALTCASPPTETCVELALGERVCPLYLVQGDALAERELNFVTDFGEADNPFTHPPSLPGT